MAASKRVLRYAVRFPVVAKYAGQLALVLAALILAPLAVGVYDGDFAFVQRCLVVLVALAACGALLARIAVSAQIQTNEALVITAAAYVFAPLVLSYPLSSGELPWIDALFEAVSGVTTTGLTTIADIEQQSRSVIFLRAWAQWFGGLGIVVLSVALLLGHQVAARRLVDPERAGENLAATMRLHARRVLVVYGVLTAGGILTLIPSELDAFDAVVHVLAGVSTGGFSSFGSSLAAVESWAARSATLAVALLGAISLPLYYHAWSGDWRRLVTDAELRALLMATVLVAALLWLLLPQTAQYAPAERLAQAAWLAVSAQTTTGFSTLPVAELGAAAKLTLIGSMAVGGSVGSTAGGIKLLRLILLLRLLQLVIQRAGMPAHAVAAVRFSGRPVGEDELVRALLLILMFLAVVFLSWLVFVTYGHDPLNALFEVVSAVGTVGLTTGITGTELSPVLKVVLCADMLLGRVEFIAVLVLLYPPTWMGKRLGY